VADKTIEVNGLNDDDTGDLEDPKQIPTIACTLWLALPPFPETCSDKQEACQQNISEMRHLGAIRAELHAQQEHAKASQPKPRPVQHCLKDLDIRE